MLPTSSNLISFVFSCFLFLPLSVSQAPVFSFSALKTLILLSHFFLSPYFDSLYYLITCQYLTMIANLYLSFIIFVASCSQFVLQIFGKI